MSAFVCSPTHIATCAALIKNSEPTAALDMTVEEIAIALAVQNIASVATRYWPSKDMLPEDPKEWIRECRRTMPRACRPEEGYAYLGCLEYQSCEAAGWENSLARELIAEGRAAQAYQMQRILLGERRAYHLA